MRDRNDGNAAELRQRDLEPALQLLEGGLGILHQIPLVDGEDQRAALFLHLAGDGEILLLQQIGGIQHQDHHLGKADGLAGLLARKPFEALHHLAAPAQPRRIHHPHPPAAMRPLHGDRIAGDAGLGTGQEPFFPDQLVDERRLADIGPPDHRELQRPGWAWCGRVFL